MEIFGKVFIPAWDLPGVGVTSDVVPKIKYYNPITNNVSVSMGSIDSKEPVNFEKLLQPLIFFMYTYGQMTTIAY